jgi:hypothetical protein
MSGKRPAGVGALCVPRSRNLPSRGRTIAVAAFQRHVRAVPEAHRSAARARPRRVHGSYDPGRRVRQREDRTTKKSGGNRPVATYRQRRIR